MLFLTLPDSPPSSVRGLTHLLIIGLVLVLSLVLITLLAFYERDVPDVLTFTAVGGGGYLFGANAVASTRRKDDGDK